MIDIISAEVNADLRSLLEVLQNNDDCAKYEQTSNNSEAAFELVGEEEGEKKEIQRTMQMSIITFSPLSTRPILITP